METTHRYWGAMDVRERGERFRAAYISLKGLPLPTISFTESYNSLVDAGGLAYGVPYNLIYEVELAARAQVEPQRENTGPLRANGEF